MLQHSISDNVGRTEPPAEGAPAESLFQRLLDRLPAGAYMCDPDGLITYFNEHAVRLWGRAPRLRDPVDRFCGSFKLFTASGAPLAHDRCWMALALADERDYNGEEIVVARPDGMRLNVLAHANPVYDHDGTLVGAVNVLVDITDQKKIAAALAEADQAKSEFLATVSHEIRTPINAILGYLDLLNLELQGPLTDGQRSQLSRVQSASEHLLSLINQVLDVARLDAEQMVVRGDPIRAGHTVDAAMSVVHPLAAARGITLRRSSDGDARARYIGDEDRVRQMLVNLLSNAIKFSEPGGRVDLSWHTVDRPEISPELDEGVARWVRFRVADDGAGIRPEHLSRIFEPFVQLESSRTRTRGGTGLGLTISRRLARELGGDLTVESTLGEGSTFNLWLPAHDSVELEAVAGTRPRAVVQLPGAQECAVAGDVILGGIDRVIDAYVARLRAEALGPGAATLAVGRLGSHAAMMVAHIAVSLRCIEADSADSALLAPGSEVLRVCAAEHGRQRAEFGWDETAVVREFEVLSDALVSHVREHYSGEIAPEAVSVIRCRVEQAKTFSLVGLHTPG